MDANPYSPPQSDVEVVAASDPTYYVVSTVKFTLLYFATLGLYGIYWFYRNWKSYKSVSGENIWPVPRALFSIFFVHSLFSKVDGSLQARGIDHKWSPRTVATWFVVLSIISNVLDRASAKGIGSPVSDVLSVLVLPATWYALLLAQRAVNMAEGDPRGESNARLSGGNFAWLAVGALLWIAVVAGILVSVAGLSE